MTSIVLISIMVLGWLYLYKNFKYMNLLHIYLISYLFFFDMLTLIYINKNNANMDKTLIMFTIFYIFASISIIFFIFIFLNKNLKQTISYKYLIKKSSDFPNKTIIILFIINSVIIIYYFLHHGLIFRVSSEYSKFQILNEYRIIMTSFVIPIFFLVLIVSSIKCMKYEKYKYIFVFFIVSILMFFLLYGRREFILSLILILTIVHYLKNDNLFSLKKIPILTIGLFIIVVASNIYQNIRIPLANYSVTGELRLDKNILDYAFDFEASDKNIHERMPLFNFVYLTTSKIFDEDKQPLHGELLIQSLINAMPSVLLPSKKVVLEEDIICKNLQIPFTDYPNSLLASFMVDFGILAFVFLPLFMLFVLIIYLFLLNKFKNNNILFMTIITLLIYFLFNLEMTITGVFVNLRNLFLIIILFYLIKFLRKIIKGTI